MRLLRHLPLLLGLAAAGCATKPQLSDSPVPPSNPFLGLHKGMSVETVRGLVGEPLKVTPLDPVVQEGETLERQVWTYHRVVSKTVSYVPTHTKEVPYIDPFTNQTKMLHEPVYQNVTITVNDVIELLLIDQVLFEMHVRRDTDHHID